MFDSRLTNTYNQEYQTYLIEINFLLMHQIVFSFTAIPCDYKMSPSLDVDYNNQHKNKNK